MPEVMHDFAYTPSLKSSFLTAKVKFYRGLF